ncbi:MAG: hydrolase [marine bacterium B5-7]|nr:MAG: hydrolase [marine bacterium B5-7]
MTSNELNVVNKHLRKIARRASNPLGGVESKRALVDEYAAAHPSILEVNAKVTPVSFEKFQGEWVSVDTSSLDRRILYLHGGSWMAGRVEKYRPHIARIAAATSCAVLAIDYRLAPENPFPKGLKDCVTAYEWMRCNGPEISSAASSSYIMGDSAGGNLTLATLLVLKDKQIDLPDAAVALSPATDMSWSSSSIKTNAKSDVALNAKLMPLVSYGYLQKKVDPKTPYASPLFGDLQGLPPILLQVGDTEILLDDAVGFVEKAQAAGVDATLEVFSGMPHVFQAFAPYLPEANQALQRIGEFITRIPDSMQNN